MGVEKDHIKKSFGVLLSELRTQRNMTHAELEDLSGITRKHIYNLEKGIHEPTLSNLFRLAIALKIKPTRFIQELEDDILKDS